MTLTTATLQTLRSNKHVDPFGANVSASLTYSKAEKLNAATFFVTNYVPESEPLRARIRDTSIAILTDTLSLMSGALSTRTRMLDGILANVRLQLSLLDALFISEQISQTNLDILKSAYAEYAQAIEHIKHTRREDGATLTQDYFGTMAQRAKEVPTQHASSASKPAPQYNTLSLQNPAAATTVAAAQQAVQSARAETIVEYVRKRGEATVPDIESVMSGCSRKTLQRDLNTLIDAGTLTKTGTKRWTKYRAA